MSISNLNFYEATKILFINKENKKKRLYLSSFVFWRWRSYGFQTKHEGWLQIGYKTCKKQKPLLLTFYIFTQYLNMFKRGWDLSCGREVFQLIKTSLFLTNISFYYIVHMACFYGAFFSLLITPGHCMVLLYESKFHRKKQVIQVWMLSKQWHHFHV